MASNKMNMGFVKLARVSGFFKKRRIRLLPGEEVIDIFGMDFKNIKSRVLMLLLIPAITIFLMYILLSLSPGSDYTPETLNLTMILTSLIGYPILLLMLPLLFKNGFTTIIITNRRLHLIGNYSPFTMWYNDAQPIYYRMFSKDAGAISWNRMSKYHYVPIRNFPDKKLEIDSIFKEFCPPKQMARSIAPIKATEFNPPPEYELNGTIYEKIKEKIKKYEKGINKTLPIFSLICAGLFMISCVSKSFVAILVLSVFIPIMLPTFYSSLRAPIQVLSTVNVVKDSKFKVTERGILVTRNNLEELLPFSHDMILQPVDCSNPLYTRLQMPNGLKITTFKDRKKPVLMGPCENFWEFYIEVMESYHAWLEKNKYIIAIEQVKQDAFQGDPAKKFLLELIIDNETEEIYRERVESKESSGPPVEKFESKASLVTDIPPADLQDCKYPLSTYESKMEKDETIYQVRHEKMGKRSVNFLPGLACVIIAPVLYIFVLQAGWGTDSRVHIFFYIITGTFLILLSIGFVQIAKMSRWETVVTDKRIIFNQGNKVYSLQYDEIQEIKPSDLKQMSWLSQEIWICPRVATGIEKTFRLSNIRKDEPVIKIFLRRNLMID
ncbi:MAG: hypothetical protein ACFFCS_08895 [Candidatus Hodarchaeota archaeon]